MVCRAGSRTRVAVVGAVAAALLAMTPQHINAAASGDGQEVGVGVAAYGCEADLMAVESVTLRECKNVPTGSFREDLRRGRAHVAFEVPYFAGDGQWRVVSFGGYRFRRPHSAVTVGPSFDWAGFGGFTVAPGGVVDIWAGPLTMRNQKTSFWRDFASASSFRWTSRLVYWPGETSRLTAGHRAEFWMHGDRFAIGLYRDVFVYRPGSEGPLYEGDGCPLCGTIPQAAGFMGMAVKITNPSGFLEPLERWRLFPDAAPDRSTE